MASSPAMIGPYRVVRELGRGGMGVVWEVRHAASPRPLALKQVLADVADGEALTRFTREAELLARLRHPGVVAIHAFGTTEAGPYLVTDLVVGRDLKELARGGPLAPRRAAELVAGVADAVEAVHGHGLLHRDLKPGNVIVQERDGRPVLLDFGLARELDGSSLTQSGALVGTPGFMAPEQVDGQRDLDARADVYGLGAILFFLLAGRAPFEGSLVNVFARALTSEPEWPRAAPPGLVAITRKAMAKERGARYPRAAALADDLRRWLAGERPLAQEGAAARRLVRGLLLLAAVAVLAAAGAAVVVALLRAAAERAPGSRPPPEPVAAPGPVSAGPPEESPASARRSGLQALRGSGAGRLEAWRELGALAGRLPAPEREALERDVAPERLRPLVAVSAPPGARIAHAAFARAPAGRLVYGWLSAPLGRSRLLATGEETAWTAAFGVKVGLRAVTAGPGPDDLLLVSGAYHLTTLAAGAASPETRWSVPGDAPSPARDLFAAAAHPSGLVAVGGKPATVWLIEARSWSVREVLDSRVPDDLVVESLAFSRDGARLAVVRTESRGGGPIGRVDVWEVGRGAAAPAWRPVPQSTPRPRCAAFAPDGSLVVGFDGGHVWRYREGSDAMTRELSDEAGLGSDAVAVRVDGAGSPIVVTGVSDRPDSGLLVARGLPGAAAPVRLVDGGPAFTSLDLSSDDTLLVTGDREGTVKVWGWRLGPGR